MLYFYAVVSAALIPILDRNFPILRENYSVWLVPLLFVCFFIGFILLHLAVVIISFLCVNVNKPPKCYKYYRFLAKITMPMVLSILRVKVVITGEELLPQEKRFVLASNHTHLFDPLIYLGKFPEAELAFIGKKEISKKMRIVAGFMWSLKGMFVDRDDPRSGAKVLINSVKLLKNDEVSIGIFPEGTRSKDGKIGEFKSGAVKMAIKAKVPFCVCTVKGVTEILKNFPFLPTTVYLDVLKVYDTADYETKTAEQISEEARNLMIENTENK